ncbi:hypothetical protein L0128_07660 [candidate division KSB1 bacterium]|nr:hypothetical protein [candidate division KSB1 bacterium]
MLFPQKAIGLIGQELELTILAEHAISVEIVGCPQNLEPLANPVQGQGKVSLRFRAIGLSYQQRSIKLRITDVKTEQKQIFELQARVFAEKESFICLVMTSNIHYGWDPETAVPTKGRGKQVRLQFAGEIVGNDGFSQTTDWVTVAHQFHAPITWLTDDVVALKLFPRLGAWHTQFGDDYGLLPRSYYQHNARNYNTEISQAQTTEILTILRDAMQDISSEANYLHYTRIMGVDPWVGAIGTNFVKAAQQLGLEGIWGIAYDQHGLDTSFFHRGAPWDAYKPRLNHFRAPSLNTNLWLFPWTTCDLLNSAYFSPSGSTFFNTEVNLQQPAPIAAFQDDYYARLLAEYKKNLPQNDFSLFVLHQADHNAHTAASTRTLAHFLEQVHADNLMASLEEVTAWLNLKYRVHEHPVKILELNDPLTCHATLKASLGKKSPAPPLTAHPTWGQGPNPPHLVYCGLDAQWIARAPESLPFIYYHYARSEHYPITETGEFPIEILPEVTLIAAHWQAVEQKRQLSLQLQSKTEYENLPWIIWNAPVPGAPGHLALTEATQGEVPAFYARTALIIWVKKINPGLNQFLFNFSSKIMENPR